MKEQAPREGEVCSFFNPPCAEAMKRVGKDRNMQRQQELLRDIELFVLDMDGTFYCGDRMIEGSLCFLEAAEESGKKYMFFTNNSSRAPEQYIKKLASMGCRIARDQIMTSGDVAIQYLKTMRPRKTVYLLGTPELEADFAKADIPLTKDAPDIVMVGFDQTLTYEKLERACTYIRGGAEFLSTHPDINCPVDGGFIPDSGAICAAIALSTGKSPRYLGKPYGETVQMITGRTGVPIERIAFVGDRLYTDIAVGVNHGAKGFLVLSGETTLEDLEESQVRPDAVFKNLAEIGRILSENKKS